MSEQQIPMFDPGYGPIRDLKWLDPDGTLQREIEQGLPANWKPRLDTFGFAPISYKFDEDGNVVEWCNIQQWRRLQNSFGTSLRSFADKWEVRAFRYARQFAGVCELKKHMSK